MDKRSLIAVVIAAALAACTADGEPVTEDFGFDGTCVNCHAGLSAGHVHANYKLRCVDCHGGNDQAPIPARLFEDRSQPLPRYRDPALLAQAHVVPKSPKLARFFFANGVDDDGDGKIDEPPVLDAAGTQVLDFGEIFEPQLHGEGAGEFIDTELSRDLNYTRFLNPGDLRVATVGCGVRNRGAEAGGFGCHQQTIDVVRRNIMVNQSAVINGAYYGNESWRPDFAAARGATPDPRAGAFAYSLDYDGADVCIDPPRASDDVARGQPTFNSDCLERRAAMLDPSVAAGAPGNAGLPAFEIAQNGITPAQGSMPGTTLSQTGANDTRLPWGGNTSDPTGERAKLAPVLNADLLAGIPDPVDAILRTFRAYYPLNYPGSTNNFDFTFGTSIVPDITRFKTANPYGRGHSSGCAACHAPYAYDGSRAPTQVRADDGTVAAVVDPTTQHREFRADQDSVTVGGQDHLLGRAVNAAQQAATGRAQQKTYSANHAMTTKIDTDTCGLCHGFVTRINLAYQGMAEEEQRDQLARRKRIEFDTPGGKSHVRILDSWVREDNQLPGAPAVRPDGLAVIDAARARDEMLAAQGLFPGAGGCAQATFSEDCNNNGELDHSLALSRVDEDGNVLASVTIDEDANHNGALDLIDRVPREKSIDGRQMRYVYGGRNGSTRQMDVHFERGMHCIDCHFLQDVHGDGHVYSTNWDAIEIECEDCHGARARSTLLTSGPNGGNDLRRARNDDLQPFFEVRGDAIIQRSRVTPGVFWVVPQTVDAASPLAREAHTDKHVAEPRQGSTFQGAQGASPLVDAKVECQTCHSSWVHNCMACHVDINVGDPQRKLVAPDGSITKSARENEVWLSNASSAGHVNFQLQGLLRSPFVLGTGSAPELGRLAPFRSSMQVHLSLTDANGDTIADNQTFTTFQAVDANSRRANVATSGVAMNQTMPHTTRPSEARGCESCHSLVDPQGRVRNEHVLAETFGLGTGAYPYVGDWAIAAGTGGLELYEYKQERELAANKAMTSQRFPGMIVNAASRTAAKVEPLFDGSGGVAAGSVAVDVALVRNFNAAPAIGGTRPPTLRDLAILAVDAAGAGKLVISDITRRGHPTSARAPVGDPASSFVLALPAAPTALAHLAPDVSDPFVYVAVGALGVSVIRLLDAPGASPAAQLVRTVALPSGRTASDVALAGDLLYVGTQQGTVEALSISDPEQPSPVGSATIGHPVTDLAVGGFVLYVATASGVAALSLDNPANPAPLPGGSLSFVAGAASGLAVGAGHLYVAAGPAGVIDVDVRTPAAPVVVGNLAATLAPGQPINAVDVVISKLPGQTWLLALDAAGDLWGLKLDNRQSIRERCFPDPRAAGCLLDMDFLDPTIMQRDPSFDPNTNTFDAADPSSPTFFHQPPTILGAGKRLARPAIWEQLNTLTGRRLRDSFMPGSGTLSLSIMLRMRGVKLCESTAPSHTPGGLNQLGYATGAACQPIGESAATAARTATPARPATADAPGPRTQSFGEGGAATMWRDPASSRMQSFGGADAGVVAGGVCRAQAPPPLALLRAP